MYRLKVKERAEKDLKKLAPVFRSQIITAVRALAENPRPQGAIRLTEREEWRIRQGDYRVLNSIDDRLQEVIIVRIKLERLHEREPVKLKRPASDYVAEGREGAS